MLPPIRHVVCPLQVDILQEASNFANRILVKHENEDLSLYDHWEPVTAMDVQTPNEVYAELRGERLPVVCWWLGDSGKGVALAAFGYSMMEGVVAESPVGDLSFMYNLVSCIGHE